MVLKRVLRLLTNLSRLAAGIAGPALILMSMLAPVPSEAASPVSVWEAVEKSQAEVNNTYSPIYTVIWSGTSLFDNFGNLSPSDTVLIDDWPMLISDTTQDGFVPLLEDCYSARVADEDEDEDGDEDQDGAISDEAADEDEDGDGEALSPCEPRTAAGWREWRRFYAEGGSAQDLFTMQWYLSEVSRHSALFGDGELFGPLTTSALDTMLAADSASPPVDALRAGLLACWLDVVTQRIPFPKAVDLAAVPGAEPLIGTGVMPVYNHPIPPDFPRGGVLGRIEDIVQQGPDDAVLGILRVLCDAVSDGSALREAWAISPLNRLVTLYGESTDQSYYSYAEGRNLPPWNILPWFCTEGGALSEYVANDQVFQLTGETAPSAVRDIVRSAPYTTERIVGVGGTVLYRIIAMKDTSTPEVVEITFGPEIRTVTIDYAGTTNQEEQVLRFLDTLNAANTGVRFLYDSYIYNDTNGVDWTLYYRIWGEADRIFMLRNLAADAAAGPYFRPVYNSTPLIAAGTATATQEAIWDYMATHGSLVVGKTPLWSGSQTFPVTLKTRNIGRLESGPLTLIDVVPPGFTASDFSIPPDSVSVVRGERILRWNLPSLAGSEVIEDPGHYWVFHPFHVVSYTLTDVRPAPGRFVIPGPQVRWQGETSHGVPLVID
jgi:hypothetical protein